MNGRDVALIKLATVTVVCYTALLAVTIVAALVTGSVMATTIAAVVAALSPLLALGGVAVGRLSAGPATPTTGG